MDDGHATEILIRSFFSSADYTASSSNTERTFYPLALVSMYR